MLPSLYEKCEQFQEHFSGLLDIHCEILDVDPPKLTGQNRPGHFSTHCSYEKRDELTTHLYGCREARRWNGKYIYYCPLGLVFVSSSLVDSGGKLVGGLVLGPIVMGDPQDVMQDLLEPGMAPAVACLSSYTPKKVRHIAEILASVTAEISGVEHQKLKNLLYEQDKILNAIYSAKERHEEKSDSIDSLLRFEKQLRISVVSADKASASRLLNELLGHIFCSSQFDIHAVRARTLELLVILSRATIEAGADAAEIFSQSEEFIRQVEAQNDADELCGWISGVLHRFISQAFDFAHVKHSDVVHKVMDYIKKNYDGKLSLGSLARQVFLSKSYLSSIFKSETGMSLTAYISRVRVERSKQFLMDERISLAVVANQCGFEDQSYFTKVFKKETGVSPKRFRDSFMKIV
jgi:AraC-like DNA-binding protein